MGVELPKGVILYKKIDCYSCLKARLRHGKFFEKTKFYSSLINEIISDTDYENLKRFYKLMHMKNLSDLKDIYNMQDTILLCKIFKNCSSEIMKNTRTIRVNAHQQVRSENAFIDFYRKLWFLYQQDRTCGAFWKNPFSCGFSCLSTILDFDSSILFLRSEDCKSRIDLKHIYKIKFKNQW